MMRKILPLFFLLFAVLNSQAQNKQVLFGFAETPQTLLLNPGAETNYLYHISVPLLSGISMSFGSTGGVMADLFLKDNIDFNTKFAETISKLDENDDVSFNTQIEIVNVGYRLDRNTYITAGFYEEIDFIAYYPKDIITLFYEGNSSFLNKGFSVSQLIFNAELMGVLHFGVTRKVNKNLTLGGRLKIYSSSLNLKTNNNKGTYTTVLGDNNIYKHFLTDIHINLQSSGFITNDNFLETPEDLYRNTFLSGNLGVGIDLGFTYRASSQLEFTGSITDLGYVKYKKKNKSYTVDGSYQFEGINFEYDPLNPRDYWQELEDDFNAAVNSDENTNSYTSWRAAKINLGLRHNFGEIRLNRDCYDPSYKEYYSSAIGLQLYTIFRPLKPQFALTGFFEKFLTEKIQTKVTYTIDGYSVSNVGVGLSTKIGAFQMYGMVDNIFRIQELETANNASFQFGMNLIFN